jgi:hypothetical protein
MIQQCGTVPDQPGRVGALECAMSHYRHFLCFRRMRTVYYQFIPARCRLSSTPRDLSRHRMSLVSTIAVHLIHAHRTRNSFLVAVWRPMMRGNRLPAYSDKILASISPYPRTSTKSRTSDPFYCFLTFASKIPRLTKSIHQPCLTL